MRTKLHFITLLLLATLFSLPAFAELYLIGPAAVDAGEGWDTSAAPEMRETSSGSNIYVWTGYLKGDNKELKFLTGRTFEGCHYVATSSNESLSSGQHGLKYYNCNGQTTDDWKFKVPQAGEYRLIADLNSMKLFVDYPVLFLVGPAVNGDWGFPNTHMEKNNVMTYDSNNEKYVWTGFLDSSTEGGRDGRFKILTKNNSWDNQYKPTGGNDDDIDLQNATLIFCEGSCSGNAIQVTESGYYTLTFSTSTQNLEVNPAVDYKLGGYINSTDITSYSGSGSTFQLTDTDLDGTYTGVFKFSSAYPNESEWLWILTSLNQKFGVLSDTRLAGGSIELANVSSGKVAASTVVGKQYMVKWTPATMTLEWNERPGCITYAAIDGAAIDGSTTIQLAEGNSITFNTTAAGGGELSYKWNVNNVEQTGETSESFTYTMGNATATVKVQITGANCTDTNLTDMVERSVNLVPCSTTISVDPTIGTISPYERLSIEAEVNNDADVTWSVTGAGILSSVTNAGATFRAGTAGSYTVTATATSAKCGSASASAVITVQTDGEETCD